MLNNLRKSLSRDTLSCLSIHFHFLNSSCSYRSIKYLINPLVSWWGVLSYCSYSCSAWCCSSTVVISWSNIARVRSWSISLSDCWVCNKSFIWSVGWELSSGLSELISCVSVSFWDLNNCGRSYLILSAIYLFVLFCWNLNRLNNSSLNSVELSLNFFFNKFIICYFDRLNRKLFWIFLIYLRLIC